MTKEAIALLPLVHDARDLVALVPGARPGHLWGGANFQANNYELDGGSNNNSGMGGDLIKPNLNWIDHVEVKGLGGRSRGRRIPGRAHRRGDERGTNDFHAMVRFAARAARSSLQGAKAGIIFIVRRHAPTRLDQDQSLRSFRLTSMEPARMRLLSPLVTAVALATGAVSVSCAQDAAVRTAKDCEALRALGLANTTITVADSLSGSFVAPGTRDTIGDLPPFCRIAGEIRPTPDSHIAFEVWLPLKSWNGKFAGVGNGGFAGTISYGAVPAGRPPPPPAMILSGELRRGYATASTNTGHEGNGGDASFAYHHPERLIDFGWRAVHEVTVTGKELTRAFYGRAPQHAYWIGCSTGGKQGLTEAERFPADYDGIVAGAPASAWTPLMAATFDVTLATQVDRASFLTRGALQTLHRAVLAACDTLDGVRDGLIAEPRRCRFDPATLQCSTSGPTEGCLSPAQVDAVRRIYGGPVDPISGRRIAPGLAPGSEMGWGAFATPGRAFPIPISYYRYLVFGDTTWDWRTFDLHKPKDRAAFLAADAKYAPILAATSPDLSDFRARGGKLVQYHGWADQLITPLFSVDYYESVVARERRAGNTGDRAAAFRTVGKFYRLFMVPGMAHCGGGPGPNVFDMEPVLEAWVERGVAPDSVIATHYTDRRPDRQRPLCPYPEVAVYKGEGNVNDAASFACRVAGR